MSISYFPHITIIKSNYTPKIKNTGFLYFNIKTNKMHLFLKLFILVKTLYMFRTVFPSIIRSSKLHIQPQAYVKQLLLPAAISR